jgi:hypothetical protein
VEALGDDVVEGEAVQDGFVCQLFAEFFYVEVVVGQRDVFPVEHASAFGLGYLHYAV